MKQISQRSNANYLSVSIGKITLFFSYNTVIAFRDGYDLVIRENSWGCTTGKHLNWIDDDKSKRIPSGEFEKKLAELLKKYNLEA